MRPSRHKARRSRAGDSKRKGESSLTDKIALKQQCKSEIKQWIKIVKSKDFPTDLKKQNEAALIARGIAMKMQVLKAENAEDDILEQIAQSIVRQFGQVWEKKSIVLSTDPDNPLEVEHSIKGSIDLPGLKDAIKRDQER